MPLSIFLRSMWIVAALAPLGVGCAAITKKQDTGSRARGTEAWSWRMSATKGKWNESLDKKQKVARKESQADPQPEPQPEPDAAPASTRKAAGKATTWEWHAPAARPTPAARAESPRVASTARASRAEPARGDFLDDVVEQDSGADAEMTMDVLEIKSPAKAKKPAPEPVADSPVPDLVADDADDDDSEDFAAADDDEAERPKKHRAKESKKKAHKSKRERAREKTRPETKVKTREAARKKAEAKALAEAKIRERRERAAAMRRGEDPDKVVAATRVAQVSKKKRKKAKKGKTELPEEGFLPEEAADDGEDEAEQEPVVAVKKSKKSRAADLDEAPRIADSGKPAKKKFKNFEDGEGFVDTSRGRLPKAKTDWRGQVVDSEDPLK